MRLSVAKRLILGIGLVLVALLAAIGAMALSMQAKGLQELTDISGGMIEEMLAEDLKAGQKSVVVKAENLGKLLAGIAPEMILSYNFSSLLEYARVATDDPDIVSARFQAPDGKPIAEAGSPDKAAGTIQASVKAEGATLGTVVLGYGFERLEAQRAAAREATAARLAAMESARGEAMSRLTQRLGLTTLAALALGVAVAILLARSITRPLRSLMDFAAKVARGDLKAKPVGTFQAELGQLKTSIETMVGALEANLSEAEQSRRRAMEESEKAQACMLEAREAQSAAERARHEGALQAAHALEALVDRVSSASEELASRISESSGGIENQKARIAETASALEEMNASILEVARNSGQAASSAGGAQDKANSGSGVVRETIGAIETMRERMDAMKKSLGELGKQAEGVGSVIGIISDIADQTNLLALNAAIEAARAGDAGRGFAVVADEVRKLAEKTMSATREVNAAITAIQGGTRQSVGLMDEAARDLAATVTLTDKAGGSLDEIVAMAVLTADMVRNIATAAEEQSASSEEITRATDEINVVAGETAQAMRLSSEAVEELARTTDELRGVIRRMQEG